MHTIRGPCIVPSRACRCAAYNVASLQLLVYLVANFLLSTSAALCLRQDVYAGILLQKYQALVDKQVLRPDAQQQACVQQLSQLCDRLSAYSTEVEHFQAESLRYLVHNLIFALFLDPFQWQSDQLRSACSASQCHDWIVQAEAAQVRADLKRQEAEARAKKKQQDAQRTGLWHEMMKRMQPQQAEETSSQEVALVTARAREGKVQEILGPPPEAPSAPKGLQTTRAETDSPP